MQATLALCGDVPAGMFIAVRGDEIPQRRRSDLLALFQSTAPERRDRLKQNLQDIEALTAPVASDNYYLRTIAVDASQRRRGIGRQLVGRAIDDARAIGSKGVRLDVDSDNDAALRLYRSLGFESVYEGFAPKLGLRMYSMLKGVEG